MKSSSFFRTAVNILFSVIVMLLMTACVANATQQPAAEQTVSDTPEAASSGDTAVTAATQEPTPAPTDTPEPTLLPPTATLVPEPLIITAQGFGQGKRGQVGYGFIVENPNQAFGVYGAKYTISYYDANDAVLNTEDGDIASFLPGQKLGVAGSAFLGNDITVSKIDIQLVQGKVVPASFFPADVVLAPLGAEKINYRPAKDQYSFDDASGVVVNPYDMTLGYTRVSFIAYNAAGEIIGGGWDTLGFLTPKGSAGAHAEISSFGEVDHVEMYPAVNSIGDPFTARKLPEGAQEPTLVKQGYAQSESSTVGWGLVVQNPNTNYLVIENIQVTFYAEDGSVLGSDSDQITLYPNATSGVGGYSSAWEGEAIARADILINSVIFRESGELSLPTVDNYSVVSGDGFQKVTGEVSNPTAADMNNVTIYAVAYNDAGDIIGGGRGGVDLVSANGKSSLEMTIFAPGTVATLEFYTLYDIE